MNKPVVPHTPAVDPQRSWSNAVETFLALQQNDHTKRAYQRWLTNAGEVMGEPLLASLDSRHLSVFQQYVLTYKRDEEEGGDEENDEMVLKGKQFAASRAQAITTMRSFVHWWRIMDDGAHVPLVSLETLEHVLKGYKAKVKQPYSILSDPEIEALLDATANARDKALIALVVGTGLRVSEVVHLNISDILTGQEGGAVLQVKQGKGAKDRAVPITPGTLAYVLDYLERTERHLSMRGPLFRSYDFADRKRDGTNMSEGGVWVVVTKAAERAGIRGKHISPHALRHTFAIRFLRSNRNTAALQKLLGHASLATTQIYLDHFELAELRQLMPELPDTKKV